MSKQEIAPPSPSPGPSSSSSLAASSVRPYPTPSCQGAPYQLPSAQPPFPGQTANAGAARIAAITGDGTRDGGASAAVCAGPAGGAAAGAADAREISEHGISGARQTAAPSLLEVPLLSESVGADAPVPAADPGPPGNERSLSGTPPDTPPPAAAPPTSGPPSTVPSLWSVSGPSAVPSGAFVPAATAADEASEGAVERALRSLSLGGGAADLVALLTAGEEGIGPAPSTGSGDGERGPAVLGGELTAAAVVPPLPAAALGSSRGAVARQVEPELSLMRVSRPSIFVCTWPACWKCDCVEEL